MIEIEPFRPCHLEWLELQPGQVEEASGDPMAAARAGAMGPAFTAFDGPRPIACAGLIVNHPGYATAWARLAERKGAALLPITRAILRVLDVCGHDRVDMIVRADFEAAHRWAARLGFSPEGLLRAYLPGGADVFVYARLRGR